MWRGGHNRPGATRHDPLPLTSHFDIDWFQDGARVYLLVFGEVDLASAPHLADQVRRAAQTGLEVIVKPGARQSFAFTVVGADAARALAGRLGALGELDSSVTT